MTAEHQRQHGNGTLRVLATVCVVGLAVRLLFATVLVPQLAHRANVASDPDRYVELAASLLDRGELGFNAPGFSPTSIRGPAFPLWLAIGMSIGGRSDAWIAFWACVPGLLAALTIAQLLERSHGRLAGLAGGLLCAAHPLACFVSARAVLWFWIRAETALRTVHYALVALPLVALSLFGLTRLFAQPGRASLPAGVVVAVVALHVVTYAAICPMARYSVQVYPLICYLAGAAFAVRPRRRVAYGQPTS